MFRCASEKEKRFVEEYVKQSLEGYYIRIVVWSVLFIIFSALVLIGGNIWSDLFLCITPILFMLLFALIIVINVKTLRKRNTILRSGDYLVMDCISCNAIVQYNVDTRDVDVLCKYINSSGDVSNEYYRVFTKRNKSSSIDFNNMTCVFVKIDDGLQFIMEVG